MMKKSSLFLSRAGACGALALLFALFSCNKFSDLSDPDGDGLLRPGQSTEPKVIRYECVGVGVEGQSQSPAQSKVTFDETSGAFSWQSGDVIRIQRSESAAVDVTITTSGSAASVEVPLVGSETRAGFAYYPASIQPNTAVSAVRSTSVTLPDTYSDYAYPYAPTPMLAVQADADGVLTGSNLNFQHLGGLMLLTVNITSDVTADVTRIKVTFDKRVCGDFTAAVSGGYYQIATDDATSNTTLTYNLATPVAAGSSQKLFIPLPVGTYTVSAVTGYDASGTLVSAVTSASASQTLARRKGKKVSVTMAKPPLIDNYSPYELVYGTGNCIIDEGTTDNRNVSFDATPYLADADYLYTNTPAEMSPLYKETPVSAKVLWYEDGISFADAANAASLNTNTYQVTVSGISGTGNCVVGLYNESNEIVWSFHIWSPGWDPTTANIRTYTGTDDNSYKVMGAALGATASSTAKVTTWSYTHCGMYYQWGRKDPLGRVNSSKVLSGTAVQSGIVPSTSNVIAANSSTIGDSESVADHIAYSIKNPHMFITNGSGSYAWFSTYTTYTETNANWDNRLWGTLYDGSSTYTEIGKTIFDPCPAGWKVVTTGIVFGKTTGSSAGSGTKSVGYRHTSPNDYFVYSGSRPDTSGAVGRVADKGYYWSSCQYGSSDKAEQSLYMYGSSYFDPTDKYNSANGLTVRCVRLQN